MGKTWTGSLTDDGVKKWPQTKFIRTVISAVIRAESECAAAAAFLSVFIDRAKVSRFALHTCHRRCRRLRRSNRPESRLLG